MDLLRWHFQFFKIYLFLAITIIIKFSQEVYIMKETIIFFAEGFEEVEALTQVDMLRRAGACVTMVSITNDLIVKGSHGILITADTTADKLPDKLADMYILPGGMPGTKNLDACDKVSSTIKSAYESGKIVSAICAAPSVLGHLGILKGRKACCYPGFEKELLGADVCYDSVAVDGNVITSRGLGTAINFALKLIEVLFDKEKSEEIGKSIVYNNGK